MTDPHPAWTRACAWLSLAAIVLVAGAGLRLNPSLVHDSGLLWIARFFSLPVVGVLLAIKRPRLPVGWLLLGIGFAIAASRAMEGVGVHLFGSNAEFGAVVYLAGAQLMKVTFAMAGLLILLFPNGRLPSPRWRWLSVALAALVALALLGGMVEPGPVHDPLCTGAACSAANAPTNPLAVAALPLQRMNSRGDVVVFCLLLLAAAASLVARYPHATVDDRQRLKWFIYAAVILAAVELGGAALPLLPETAASGLALPYMAVESLVTAGAVAGIAIAVLRHRLFDIDLVISRTAAYASLAALIASFYAVIVIGVGALLGGGSSVRLVLSVLATGAIAVAFQSLRLRLQRLADRLVYGRRASPYEVLAGFTGRLAQAVSWEQLLPEMARVLTEGTASEAGTVWLERNESQLAAGSWPLGAVAVEPDTATRVADVHHRGAFLGRLAVRRPNGEGLSPTEERLMDDLAHQAGFVLDNVRLREEVRLRLEELRESRARLVAVQDAERRRLERNLHDGAQQNLVSLRMKLGLAQAAATHTSGPLSGLLEQMQMELGEALDSVRSLSRGIYPPLLESQGLKGALTARARQIGIPVTVDCGPERHPPEVEVAIYFCCAEALQNVSKHSGAGHATLRVWSEDGGLRFTVSDDGRGFSPSASTNGHGLQNLRDRLETLGGTLDVQAGRGRGTRVTGWLPVADGTRAMSVAGRGSVVG